MTARLPKEDRLACGACRISKVSELLPHRIYTYWHQGLDDAPPIVNCCVERMRQMNPSWEVIVHDAGSAESIIESIPVSAKKLDRLSLPHLSDLIRTSLLIDHGGVWIDPTVYLSQPFDTWIHSRMGAGVFLFSNPGRDRLISNWFIASSPSNAILKELFEALCEYWEYNHFRNHSREASRFETILGRLVNRNLWLPRLWLSWPFRKLLQVYPYMIYHYMIYHYLFCDLVRRDSELAGIYSEMPKVPAEGAISLHRYGVEKHYSPKAKRILKDPSIPLHKLRWKNPKDSQELESILTYLIRSTGTSCVSNRAAARFDS